jgi:hypothetical protein
VAVALALVAGACTLPPPYEGGSSNGPTVVVIGDSLVDFGSASIKPAMQARGWRVSLHGEPTMNTATAQHRITGAAVANPMAAVLVTTANDAFDLHRGAQTAAQVASTIDRAMVSTDKLSCVVWVLLNEHAWFYGFPQWAPVVNQMVMQRAPAHTNVRLLDWRHQVVFHPEWFQADLFHHTPAGNANFAAQMTAAVSGCPGFS